MRIIDRYLMKQLLVPIIFCSLTLISLVLIADVFDHLNDFLRNETPLRSIFRYYLLLIPFAFVETIAWATLLGSIYLLATASAHNELIAMKTAGFRISAISRPMLFVGFLIGVFSFFVSDQILPQTYRAAQAIKNTVIQKKVSEEGPAPTVLENVTYYGTGNRLYYARFFYPTEERLVSLIILFLNESGNVQRKIFCQQATWEEGSWRLSQVTDYHTNPQGKILGEPRLHTEKSYPELSDPPRLFLESAQEQHFLSYRELKDLVRRLEDNKLRAYPERGKLHFMLSRPWHSLIMVLLSIPFLGITQKRKRLTLNLLFLLGVVFSFHVMGAVSMALGKAGLVPPPVGAWLNSFLFASSSLFFFNRANY